MKCTVFSLRHLICKMIIVIVRCKASCYDKVPFGLQMCVRLCDATVGCSQYEYSSTDLGCVVKTNTQQKSLTQGTITLQDNSVASMTLKKVILRTRSLRIVIVNGGRKTIAITDGIQQADEPRLVVTAAATEDTPEVYRHFFLHNMSMELSKNIRISGIMAVFYSSMHKKIFLSSAASQRIFKLHLTSIKVSLYQIKMNFESMAEDTHQKLIFLTSCLPKCRLVKIRRSLKPRVIVKDSCRRIAVDVRNRMIYIATSSEMISVNYFGNDRRVFVTDPTKCLTVLTFDTVANVLYYAINQNIFKFDLRGSVNSKYKVLKYSPHNLVYYKDTLYTTSTESDHRIGTIASNGTVTMIEIKYTTRNIIYLSICIIP